MIHMEEDGAIADIASRLSDSLSILIYLWEYLDFLEEEESM